MSTSIHIQQIFIFENDNDYSTLEINSKILLVLSHLACKQAGKPRMTLISTIMEES